MGKKRKLSEVLDPDAEKTLYTSFVTAANSISSLYTQAVQQQRKSSAAASRLTLVRHQAAWAPTRMTPPLSRWPYSLRTNLFSWPWLQERIAAFIMREYPGEEHVPKAALLHFLHQEYEVSPTTTC